MRISLSRNLASSNVLYTDASLKNKIGIGGYAPRCLKYSFVIDGKKDINRAELAAIYAGMLIMPDDKLHVVTDSITAIQLLKKNKSHAKYQSLVDCILFVCHEKFGDRVQYTKVKSHSGVFGNDVADMMAGVAAGYGGRPFIMPDTDKNKCISDLVFDNIRVNSLFYPVFFL